MHWEENTWRKVWAMFLLEMGLPYYAVIRATRRSSHLQSKGNTFISQLYWDTDYSRDQIVDLPHCGQVLYPWRLSCHDYVVWFENLFSFSTVMSILETLIVWFVIICWCNFYNQWSRYSLCISGKATRVGAVPGITTSIENRIKVTLYCCHIN